LRFIVKLVIIIGIAVVLLFIPFNVFASNNTGVEYIDEENGKNPSWVQHLFDWYDQDLIEKDELQSAIKYLINHGILNIEEGIKEIFLEPKIKNQTILAMVDFRQPRFNEGQPIVFEGKLTDYLGNPISHVPILIRSDGPCPANHIIALGITDKHGLYKIFTKTLLWDEQDGLITTFAEFLGTESFEQSVSEPQLVVVYPVKGEKCIG